MALAGTGSRNLLCRLLYFLSPADIMTDRKQQQHLRPSAIFGFRLNLNPQLIAELSAQVQPYPGRPLMVASVTSRKSLVKNTGKLFRKNPRSIIFYCQAYAILFLLRTDQKDRLFPTVFHTV